MSLLGKFKKRSARVGLDIGSRSLKLVEIQDDNGELVLTAAGLRELKPGVVENGDIKDEEAFISALKTLVDNCNSDIQEVNISLGGQGILSDKMIVKVEDGEDQDTAIRFEASRRSPFDASDITMDYKTLRHFPETNEVEVLLVAAKNQIMEKYIDILYEADLKPLLVDVSTFAFNNCYSNESYAEPTLPTLVLMDIGHTASRIVFIKDGLFHSTRDISTAGDYFAKIIERQLKISEEDSQNLLHGRTVAGVDAEAFKDSLEYALEEFVLSFDMAFSYYRKSEEVDSIDKIVLSGGGSYIPGLMEYLAKRASTTVVRSDPFSFLGFKEGLFGDVDPSSFSSLLTVAVGLALRKVR